MKAKELAEQLMEHPEWDVVMSADEEGNYFKHLSDVEKEFYQGNYNLEITSEPEEGDDKFKPCFLLWP